MIHFQDCLSTFDKTEYTTSTCIDESYRASNISHNNMMEDQSCVVKCHFDSATPNRSQNYPKALDHYQFALPDGVKCGNANGVHYCVRGKCEVKIENTSNISESNLLLIHRVCF